MLRKILALGLISIIFLGSTSCEQKEKIKKINLKKREAIEINEEVSDEKFIRIAVGSMITPKAGFAYYQQLLNYIGEKIDKSVKLVDRENYAEVNNLMKLGDIDIAFVCGGPYIDGHDEFGMKLLAAPQVGGETVYYSYIIVSNDSPIGSFEELRGKSFAFADPMSNSGKIAPTYMLAKMGEIPDSYFKKYIYTYAHDKSIKAVAQGIVDGAAVDSLIWEYINRINPTLTSKTKVIEKSSPYGIPPVVVRQDLDPKLKKGLKEILLNIHKDEKGREILKGMMIDRFVVIDDSAYDSIREMTSWIAKQKGKVQDKEVKK